MRATQIAVLTAAVVVFSSPVFAQELAPASETTRIVLNTAALLVGALSLLVAYAGFAMRDAGLARVQHAPAVCLRMMGGIGVAALALWLVGFNLMNSVEPGGFLGEFKIWTPTYEISDPADIAETAQWIFTVAFCLIGVAVMSGAVSERVKLWPFLTVAGLYAGIVFPVVASWVWGGGFFGVDFPVVDRMGGMVLHISAGAAAVAAAFVVGPRPGRYGDTPLRITPSTALPMAAFGAVLICVGLTGSFVARYDDIASYEATLALSAIFANTILAIAGAILAALVITKVVYKRAGLVSSVNALIGAIAAISCDPLSPALWQAAMIGAAAGVIVTVAPPFFDKLRIDDAGFVIPAHLFCGILGAVIVPWTNSDAQILNQLIAAASIAVFSFLLVLMGWGALRYTVGVRHVAADEHFLEDNDSNS